MRAAIASMKKFLTLILMLYSAGIFAADARKIALVIGNASYPSARLKNPVNDANALAARLREAGFDVVLKTDANQKEMSRAINQFGERIKLGGTALFYYAGHGIQVRGKNFLIPVDADIGSEAGVRGESVDLDQVLDQLGTANVGLVILDACRNNPFETRFRRSGGAGLAQVDAPTGTLLAYATAPGKTASDGNGGNGLYTSALLKAMSVPGLKIEDVFKQVRNEVIRASENQQTPWESSSLTAEFYFVPDNSKPEVAVAKLREMEKDQQELLQEMHKLKAELLAMKERGAGQSATVAAAQTAASTPGIPGAESKVAVEPKPEIQLALARPENAAPSATPAIPSSLHASGWAERLKLVEQAKNDLTLVKALALLLDVSKDDDLTLLVAHDAYIRHLLWPTSYALGVDANGSLIWGIASNWKSERFSIETALEFCARKPDDKCKVVLHNGAFNVKDFLAVAGSLSAQSVSSVRTDFLTHAAEPAVETSMLSSSPMRVQKGISFKRDP